VSIEGGHFEWRRDGGSWSSAQAIVDSFTLSDGLSITFDGGTAPSWFPGDQWSFTAEAVNGVDGIRQPTDARMQWTTSTQIDVTPTDEDVEALFIGDHTIPADATITLLGSDDNFATTPLSTIIPYNAGNIFFRVTATHAKYRLTVNKGGSIQWLWMGDPLTLAIPSGVPEIGNLTKRWRMPGLTSRKALGAQIAHSFLSEASVDALVNGLSHACQYDDQRLGIVSTKLENEASIVVYSTDTLELTEEFNYQPLTGDRYISVSLQLDPAP
jgi:hypothetical protein